MTETQQASSTENVAKMANPRYVLIDAKTGQVEGRRYHTYMDCMFLDKQPPEEIEVVGERETRLLGIGLCATCEKRASGGPALKALTELLASGIGNGSQTPEDDAWRLLNGLKERGVYLSVRKANK